MSRNPHKPGASAGNTFRAEEVRALLALFTTLDRSGDPRVLMRSDGLRSARAKFLRMQESIARQLRVVRGGGE